MVSTSVELLPGNRNPDSTVCMLTMLGTELYIPSAEMHIVGLYAMGSEEHELLEIIAILEVPFIHSIALIGPNRGIVHVQGVLIVVPW